MRLFLFMLAPCLLIAILVYDMSKIEIHKAHDTKGSGTYGVAEANKLYIGEPGLVLGLIATGQACGYHFGDDGTTTAVVARLDAIEEDLEARAQYGFDLEGVLRDYETTEFGRPRSEYVGVFDIDAATQSLLFEVGRLLNKKPNTAQVRTLVEYDVSQSSGFGALLGTFDRRF